MAEPISDKQVVAVLRPLVRATGPMVDALRQADPFGLIAGAREEQRASAEPGFKAKLVSALKSVKVPGNEGWGRMDERERTAWWINRVGRFTALITAVPGLGGALADRLPIQDTVGAAAQSLLLCAIAGERGVTETGERVRLLAWVLFDREVDPGLAAGKYTGHDKAAEDEETERLTEDIAASKKKHGRVTLKAVGRALWRIGRSLLAITDELEKRPSGRFYHNAIGMLPIVGMVGNYFGERSGLKRVAKRADIWFIANVSNART
ncbi:hypothetical protein BAY61_26280 [Prauserella marina]|uniref:Uncharacterized protein n=1 Tax=Prauserella marina TaxID=530584 RepID=A0A222VVK5_9PSEU|nr:hypothetical protein [Prauserella marina]ASR37935.1 hypothetical protein BAY61_26280 [Prauserella marina]PWV73145.1 hypothetical protein DES30_10994 [Prauserella marina]SDD70776.1 hypothetical protein SAMN05421630_111179 [Prauserella marina]